MTKSIINAEATYRVPVELEEGMILPSKSKSVSLWTPLRGAILLNSYMKWCRELKGSTQEFAKVFVQDVENGKYPLMERQATDSSNWRPLTYKSVLSQLGWWAQIENQVIVDVPDSTEKEFYPNRLMILTSEQKSEDSERSRQKSTQKKPEEIEFSDSEILAILGSLCRDQLDRISAILGKHDSQ